MGTHLGKMKVLVALFVVVVAELVAGRGMRVRRGYNSSGYGLGSYGRSDERDASVSQENPCGGSSGKGYGYNTSGSRELFKDGRDSGSTEYPHNGRSFTRASASASASASSYNGHLKSNLVESLKPKH